MSRQTVDFGIDLGTTNSIIAQSHGNEITIYRNVLHQELTPSAVYLDKQGRIVVGKSARERSFYDRSNADVEFKRRMGEKLKKKFVNANRELLPEELSAEVLKDLRMNVQRATGEVVSAAVVTIPAAFELPAYHATKRAAEIAGFRASTLLVEPVAAATAYSFDCRENNVFWLVFDFGGGTFDAAVVHLLDGNFQTVNHQGDNRLGGSNVDWDIVDEILAPAVAKAYGLANFDRRNANPDWVRPFAKLKGAAEEAKITCGLQPSATITIEEFLPGASEPFEYELQRSQVEQITEPYIVRAINLARQAMHEKRLGEGTVSSVKLVGGPTMAPYFRERLSCPKGGLGIPLDFSIDPMTVVAQGAALFARGIRIESSDGVVAPRGGVALQLEYSPVGAEIEPMIGGKIDAEAGRSYTGWTVEIINATAQPEWRSGRLPLHSHGAFLTQVYAQRGIANTFLIELIDDRGERVPTSPDRFDYTVGVVPGGAMLIHNIGIGTSSNELLVFAEKGAPLPTPRRTIRLRTVKELKHGQAEDLLRIPLFEGESVHRADRNRQIGDLMIPARDIRRDVPNRSEVELTVEIDDEQLVTAEAYVPVLDMVFAEVFKLVSEARSIDDLRKAADEELKRLDSLREQADSLKEGDARQTLSRVEDEDMAGSIRRALGAANTDGSEAITAQNRIVDLRRALDRAEDSLSWPRLTAEVEETIAQVRMTIADPELNAGTGDRQAFQALERDVRKALSDRDADAVRARVNDLRGLGFSIVQKQPAFWVAFFHNLVERRSEMSSGAMADMLISQGHRAVASSDVDSLQTVVRQLLPLLPDDDPLRHQISDVELA